MYSSIQVVEREPALLEKEQRGAGRDQLRVGEDTEDVVDARASAPPCRPSRRCAGRPDPCPPAPPRRLRRGCSHRRTGRARRGPGRSHSCPPSRVKSSIAATLRLPRCAGLSAATLAAAGEARAPTDSLAAVQSAPEISQRCPAAGTIGTDAPISSLLLAMLLSAQLPWHVRIRRPFRPSGRGLDGGSRPGLRDLSWPERRGTGNGYYPRIARASPRGYLYNQLAAFRDGDAQYAPMNYLVAVPARSLSREMARYRQAAPALRGQA